jgi:hypothetical protein
MPYIFGMLRTSTFLQKNRLFVRYLRKKLGFDRFCGPNFQKNLFGPLLALFFRKFGAQNQPIMQKKIENNYDRMPTTVHSTVLGLFSSKSVKFLCSLQCKIANYCPT